MTIDINFYNLKGTDGTHYMLSSFLDGIHGLMQFMKKVAYEKETFFTTYTTTNGKTITTVSSLGKHLKRLPSYGQIFSKNHKFSPFIHFFFEEYRKHPIKEYFPPLKGHDSQGIDLFNDFVATMRKNALACKLKKQVSDWESKPKKNMKDLLSFDDELFKHYARPVAIRLDLHYHKASCTISEIDQIFTETRMQKICDQEDYWAGGDISTPRVIEGRVALEEVQKDRERLFANMKGKRSLFEHLIGYVWRIECGRAAGYHLHVLLFFDGSRVEKHEYLAQEIGAYWENSITKGRGYFHNCNLERGKYGEDWALGPIDYWDTAKREKLRDKVLTYFCKTNQLVQVIPYAHCHLFGCRFARRHRKAQGGRPRRKSSVGLIHQQRHH